MPAVRFWEQVFGQYDSTHVLIHDRVHVGTVWRVVDASPPQSSAVMQIELDTVRTQLRWLEAGGLPRDESERQLAATAARHLGGNLQGAWRRVRAQHGAAERFQEGFARAQAMLEDVRSILHEEGVPLELAALPFVESMYTPHARSSVGAAGLWQLMPATARELGLRVDGDDDQRLDPLLATRAAARLLKHNHRMLQSWPLAVTGYNHGAYGVKRAVRHVGSKRLHDLIHHYEKRTWGFDSQNFYVEALAARNVAARLEQEAQLQQAAPLPTIALDASGSPAACAANPHTQMASWEMTAVFAAADIRLSAHPVSRQYAWRRRHSCFTWLCGNARYASPSLPGRQF